MATCYEQSITIEVCTTNVKHTFGLIKHYYLRLPDKNLEIHPGRYRMGSHHTLGYMRKEYNVIECLNVCNECYKHVIGDSLQLHDVWAYPFINCESLTRGIIGQFPVSYQMYSLTLICLLLIMSLWFFPLLLVSLNLFGLHLLYHKIESGSTDIRYCAHLLQCSSSSNLIC